MIPNPRDTDPLYTPEDVLWDPVSKEFVPRRTPLLGYVIMGISGAIVGALLMAAAVHASPPSSPSPEPSFVPVPTMPGETRVIPSAPPLDPALAQSSRAPVTQRSPEVAEAESARGANGGTPTPRPTPRPKPAPVARGHVRSGTASWYDDPRKAGLYAAAGPPLRVGDWRGRTVTISAGGHSFRVVLSDWCACRDRVIDLSPAAFSRLAPLSRGLTRVTVTW